MPIGEMPLGTTIHAIETRPGQGAVLVRSAGSSAQLLGRDGKYVILKMPSGETRMVLALCRATVGSVSNPDHGLQILGKAGRKRWLGRRPRVRGVAMNPVDHPMGGGEGRSSGGHPRSRNGLKAKGQKTRKSKQYSNNFIITRRKTGKNSK
jgi:large subunit ribosomal protein L2